MNTKHKVADFGLNWQIRNTAATHGVSFAAKHYCKRGVNVSTIRFALFGKY